MLELRISGSGSGLWPTPAATQADQGQNESDGKRGQTLVGAARGQKWPTATVNDSRSGRNRTAKRKNPNSKHHDGVTLVDAVDLHGGIETLRTYPTPTNSMMTAADMEQVRFAGNDPKRPTYEEAKKWARPHANASTGPGTQGREGGENLQTQVDRYPTPRANKWGPPDSHGKTHPNTPKGSLNPYWVEWLMGWPIGWTDCEPLATDRFRLWLRLHGIDCIET
jgi:hypothetical protein